jgi:hypothetical protein
MSFEHGQPLKTIWFLAMPDRDVKTIRDLIYYQYAKIIVRRAFGAADGKEAKAQSFL